VLQCSDPEDTLLEAGSGSAALSAELATAGRRIVLCDFSLDLLLRAYNLFEISNLPPPTVVCCDLNQSLPFRDGSVDVVWSSGVLEHWTDDELVPIVREMARVARKRVIAIVPNASCVLYRFGKFRAERSGRWPYGREIPRSTLRHVFQAAGLHLADEQVIDTASAPGLVGLTDPWLQQLMMEWWGSVACDDPVKVGQGYLLVTIGEVNAF
jgi:SAM-dependent methyltransferase